MKIINEHMPNYFTNKTALYLDHFAISGIMDGGRWEYIAQLINEGVEKELLVVLYSVEHVLENCHRDYIRALETDRILFGLSKGISMRMEPDIAAQLLINAIRNYPTRWTTYCERKNVNDFENKALFDRMKSHRETFDLITKEGAEAINTFRAASQNSTKPNAEFIELSKDKKSAYYQKELAKRLKDFSRYGFIKKDPLSFSMITINHWADEIMNILIKKYDLTKKESKKGEDILNRQGLKKIIPNLYSRACLEVAMAVKQKKENVNDHLDVMRLSSALPFADIVVTDKSKVDDIKMIGLNNEYAISLFTGTEEGINGLAKSLEEFLN